MGHSAGLRVKLESDTTWILQHDRNRNCTIERRHQRIRFFMLHVSRFCGARLKCLLVVLVSVLEAFKYRHNPNPNPTFYEWRLLHLSRHVWLMPMTERNNTIYCNTIQYNILQYIGNILPTSEGTIYLLYCNILQYIVIPVILFLRLLEGAVVPCFFVPIQDNLRLVISQRLIPPSACHDIVCLVHGFHKF